MLRRAPTTSDGKVVDRLQESTRVNKPFKPPTPLVSNDRIQPQRKRKRVSYKGQEQDDDDSDDENGPKKKKKKDDNKDKDGNYHNEEELLAAVKKYPVYKPKPFDQITSRRFSMPSMTNKEGQIVANHPSNISLGIRPQAKIIPRPLHDPMEGHAIVLYDPTIDDRETDEEKKEREKVEAKEKAANDAKEKTAGMFNPHKSLKDMLGEGKDKKNRVDKVPVVIDPRLTKVLRPHQVEGVKVRVSRLPNPCI
jgi:DNA repair and recombination RAD54-like protein